MIDTGAVPPEDRLAFWRETAGARMSCTVDPDRPEPIMARLSGLSDGRQEFLNYRSDGFWMDRTAKMCAADDRDEISLGMLVSERGGAVLGETELHLTPGDLYLIDFARPVRSAVLTHHELAVTLPRTQVTEFLRADSGSLGGMRIDQSGAGAFLASHMRTLASTAMDLNSAERALALRIASDLALAAIARLLDIHPDPERIRLGLFRAALDIIERDCGDPDLNPARVTAQMGMSRSSLYRLFAEHEFSVSDTIWEARLARAMKLLRNIQTRRLGISTVAYASGFLDPAGFSRMFRRRYGMTPSEARKMAFEDQRIHEAAPDHKL